MKYMSPLALAKGSNVFSLLNMAEEGSEFHRVSTQCTTKFDKGTLDRYFFHNGHQGATTRFYENGTVQIAVNNDVSDIVSLLGLDTVVGPVRRMGSYLYNIIGHTKDGVEIPIPKNNLQKNEMVIIDLSSASDKLWQGAHDTVRFDLVHPRDTHEMMFYQDSHGVYKFQAEKVRNYYMPPDKAVRKEYREKIDALIKKVTLLSYLKDDTSGSPAPPDSLRDFGLKISGRTSLAESNGGIYDLINNSYEAQLYMKSIVEKSGSVWNYSFERQLVNNMIKYYTQFRNEVEIDYFTCRNSTHW